MPIVWQENLFKTGSAVKAEVGKDNILVVLYILIAILIFSLIILIHEFGHFVVAKLCGIKVNEFSMGMGPKIISWGKGETKYSWRAFPIGGFVAMEGEDDDSNDPRAFRHKKVWQRLLVVLAGAFMNLVLGFVLLVIVSSFSDGLATTTVAEFDKSYTEDNAPSHVSGLEAGDKILRVNGMRVYTDTDIAYQFGVDEDCVFEMTVLRNNQKVNLPAVAFDYDTNEDGTKNLHIDFTVYGENPTFGSVISYSSRKFVSVARMIWLSLADLVKGRYSINDLSGPVGIVGAIGKVVGTVENGINIGELLANLSSFVVFITINVGIFNLLPIPALDGARAVFLIIEGIRRKPLKPEHEGMVHLIGMAALLILMAIVTVSDVMKLF